MEVTDTFWERFGVGKEEQKRLLADYLRMTLESPMPNEVRGEQDAIKELLAMADKYTTTELVCLVWKVAAQTVFLTHSPRKLMERFVASQLGREIFLRGRKEK